MRGEERGTQEKNSTARGAPTGLFANSASQYLGDVFDPRDEKSRDDVFDPRDHDKKKEFHDDVFDPRDCDKKKDNWTAVAILLVVQQPDVNGTVTDSVTELSHILYDPSFDQDATNYTTMEALDYPTNLSNVVSPSSGFYEYDGSMTIPPCIEVGSRPPVISACQTN